MWAVLDSFLISKPDLTLVPRHGILSEKPPGIVALVTDDADKKWVVRLSPMSEDHVHRSTIFMEEWESRDRPFLPEMKEPDYFTLEGHDYAIEEYEYVGEYNGDGETPQFNDLFEFVVSVSKAKESSNLPRIVFEYLYQAIHGLAELHDENWYHLDFSMENIVVHDGRSVLIDFEGSLHVPNDSPIPQLVGKDELERTKREFLPPEMMDKIEEGLVVPADIDVWNVGVTIFQAITLAFPFGIQQSIENPQQPYELEVKWMRLNQFGFEAYVQMYHDDWVFRKLWSYDGLMDLLSKIFIVYQFEEMVGQIVYCRNNMGRHRISVREVVNHEFFQAVRERSRAMSFEDDQLSLEDMTENI